MASDLHLNYHLLYNVQRDVSASRNFYWKKSKTMREQLKGNSLRKITLVTTTIGWTKLMQGTG